VGIPGTSHFLTAGWRRRISLAIGALTTAALVPGFAVLAPHSSWTPVTVSAGFAGIGLIGYFSAAVIREATLRLDADFAVALLALVLLGPVPAAVIWIATDLVAWVLKRPPLDGILANVASYGWAALAASIVLDAVSVGNPAEFADPSAYAAVVLAGLVLMCVNFGLARGIFALVGMGRNVVATVTQEFLSPMPGMILMLALGIATAFLYTRIGILALAVFALITVVPQTLLPLLLKRRLVTDLDHSAAVAVYADAIGEAMKLDQAERLVVRDAAQYVRERPVCPREGQLSDLSDAHRGALVEAVLYYREHWDGRDGIPGAVGGDMIPLSSRILAVADAWSGLTSKDSPGLAHGQALNQIEARAGMHFDPRVVKAAMKVVRRERLGRASDGAYEPWLHRVPLPRLVRHLGALANPAPPRGARSADRSNTLVPSSQARA
jgi:hypothetical protein